MLPVVLGGFILFWVYRDFDFTKAGDVLLHGTNWWWMLFSLLFGVFAQVLSWLAVETDIGTVGRFPEKERLRECYLHFIRCQSGGSPDRGGEPLRSVGENMIMSRLPSRWEQSLRSGWSIR